MSTPHLTPELIARVERFLTWFQEARMSAAAAVPGNPFGIEVHRFGKECGVACKVRSPLLRGKNRVSWFCPEDADSLEDLLAFYRSDGLRCSLSVPHGRMNQKLFRQLANAGLWSGGSGTVPALVPDGRADDTALPSPPDIQIRLSPDDEREAYLDLFQNAFGQGSERNPLYRGFQWAEDALPGRRYIAEIESQPIGMASFIVQDGIGYCGTAGVLPAFRGRGVQAALIRRHIADAPDLGANLVLGGGSPGTTTYRNFERCGLRLMPIGMSWADA